MTTSVPASALLNIGEEDIKGNEIVKQAGELLRNSGPNSTATSRAMTSTRAVDVVVCDGFVGNVALKTSGRPGPDGGDLPARAVLAQLDSPNWRRFRDVGPQGFQAARGSRRYNGAALLGLRGVVVKSHGLGGSS